MKKKTKKTQTETVPTSETSPSELKVAIQYAGKVTLKMVDAKTGKLKSVSTHNTGLAGIFSFITRALSGADCAQKYKPCRVMLYTKDKETAEYTALLISASEYTTTPFVYQDGTIATGDNISNNIKYTFSINSGAFVENAGGSTIDKVELWNSYDAGVKKICAQIEITEEAMEYSAGSNLVLEWSMEFANQVVTE